MVNTFLPYKSFKKIAKCLDNKRLGKQRVEAKQILDVAQGTALYKAWKNHPAVKQWIGYTDALKLYINAMIEEWVKRGYKNTMATYKVKKPVRMPWFVKCPAVHMSHQASLLRKHPTHYSAYFKHVPAVYMEYSYLWAGDLTKEQIKILRKMCRDTPLDLSKFAKKYMLVKQKPIRVSNASTTSVDLPPDLARIY